MSKTRWTRRIRNRLMPILVAFAIVLGMVTAITVTTAVPAHADTTTYSNLGYPWYNATTLNQATYDWGYSTCPSSDTGCKSPFSMTINGVTYGESDPWAYYLRNCTSYVAWQLAQYGVPSADFTNLGNGGDWYTGAKSKGLVTVGTTPKLYAAAVKPSTWSNNVETDPGHVAFITNITYNSDGSVSTITVKEFNHDAAGDGDTWTGPPSDRGFSEYVYFGSVMTNPPTGGSPGGGTPVLQMILDGSGQVWAQNGSTLSNSWTQETPSGEKAIAAGGGLQMILDGSGNVWAETSVSNGWTQETTGGGIQAIAAGANGQQMILDSVGQVWAMQGVTYEGGWTQETPAGEKAIAMGDNGLQMILDGSGQVWAMNSIQYMGGWTQETGSGETKISAGDAGLQMILDGVGQVWAIQGIHYLGSWTQETPSGEVSISAGSNGLQMVLDGSGNVWAQNGSTLSNTWTKESSTGIRAIAAGDSNQQMIIDAVGQVWAQSGTTLSNSWTQETPNGEAAIAAG